MGKQQTIASDKTIAVTVNGVSIYQSQIITQKEYNQLSLETNTQQIDAESGLSDAEKESLKSQVLEQLTQTDQTILDNLINNEVILQEAKNEGLMANSADAVSMANSNYYGLKAMDSQSYQALQDYMAANGLTESQYLDQSVKIYQDTITRQNLYQKFIQTLPDTDTSDQIQSAWNNYVDELVQKANIVYYNTVSSTSS